MNLLWKANMIGYSWLGGTGKEGSNGEMERRGEHPGHGLLIKLLAKVFMEAQDNLVYFQGY